MAIHKVTDQADRISLIEMELQSPKRFDIVPFRGKTEHFPVARLAIDLPMYRMQNGRTRVEQYEYLEEVGGPEDFFENGEEDISSQQAQHKILLKLAKDEKGPIFQELERVATQTAPLLLTHDGVVLNGNRRLAAMRDLFERDPRMYASFSHFDAVVLPQEANEHDLEMLEAELQMAPETKLEYGWVERRLKIRRHAEELRIPRDRIKATYRFRREQDINVELQQLALAEEYLERYLGRPHAYGEIAQKEQLFKDLEKALRGKSGAEAEIRQLVGYVLANAARKLGNRVYRYNPIFGRDFDKVMTRFAEDESIDLSAHVLDSVDDAAVDDDPLSGLSTQQQHRYEAFRPILNNVGKAQDTAEKLSRVFESITEEARDKNTKQAALKNVQKANRTLHNLDLSVADPTTIKPIKSQLNSIISISKSLITEIDKMKTKNVAAS